jgi:hypothetical protein
MGEILKSDIFFFVTTIAVIIVTIVATIMGIYGIKILRDVRLVVKDVKFKYRFIKKFIKNIIEK